MSSIPKITVEPLTTSLCRYPKRRLFVSIGLLVSASIIDMPEVAAQESSSGLMTLEEVVVTARRREELLSDIPIAITAMDENYLRDQNITELGDLGIKVPSLNFSVGGSSVNTPLITLRGQRPSEAQLTLDPAVPLYFAEVVLTPTEGTNLAMYDLASVQVLKGPQGTLFGRNSTGGAILMTPQAPGDEFGGYAEARAGNYDLTHIEGAVNLPVSDSMRFRIAGRKVERDGYQSNLADNPFAEDDQYWDEDSYGYRVSMDWSITDRLENNLVVNYDDNDAMARMAVPSAFNRSSQLSPLINPIHNSNGEIDAAIARQLKRDATKIESDVLAPDRVKNTIVSNITEFELTDSLTLKNVFGYRDVSTKNTVDADGTAVPWFGAITSQELNYTSNPELREMNADQYSEELQLLGDSLDGDLNWLIGGYWMNMEGTERYPNQVLGANPNWPDDQVSGPINSIAQTGFLQLGPNTKVDNEAWAIFGEGTYHINNEFSVTAGARYSVDDRKLEAKNFSLDTDLASPRVFTYHCAMRDEVNNFLPDDQCSRDVDESFSKPTGRLSLNYTPSDDHLLYVSVASGYRTGGFNSRATNNFTLQPFDEETVVSYEFGHKGDWHLTNLAAVRTGLAIYSQDYSDIQKTVSGTNPDSGNFETYTINAAEATINGAEFDITIAPSENLALTLAYSYVDAGYDEWDRDVLLPGSTDPVTLDYTRADFLYIPKNSATGTVSYTLPLDPDIGAVTFVAGVYWQDEMTTNDDPWLWPDLGWTDEDLAAALKTVETDAYTVLNLRIDWRGVLGSGVDLAAYVNNATDEEYITGGLSIIEDLGIVADTYGPPRTFGAVLRYNF
jgi:iron complex outermembrane receptor protein